MAQQYSGHTRPSCNFRCCCTCAGASRSYRQLLPEVRSNFRPSAQHASPAYRSLRKDSSAGCRAANVQMPAASGGRCAAKPCMLCVVGLLHTACCGCDITMLLWHGSTVARPCRCTCAQASAHPACVNCMQWTCMHDRHANRLHAACCCCVLPMRFLRSVRARAQTSAHHLLLKVLLLWHHP